MARGRGDELLFAGELELDRTAGLERGERADILGQHFLLAAEAAAHAFAKDANAVRHKIEKVTELLLGNVRRLAAGADVKPIVVEPGDRAMRLEMRVLDAMRGVSALVDYVGLFESRLDVADVAVNFEQDILPGAPDAGLRALVVDDGRALAHRFFGIEDRGQQLVIDLQLAASLFRRASLSATTAATRWPTKSHNVVEHVGVVGIDVIVVVSGGGVQKPRHILPRVHAAYARNGEGSILANRRDARVGVRRPRAVSDAAAPRSRYRACSGPCR